MLSALACPSPGAQPGSSSGGGGTGSSGGTGSGPTANPAVVSILIKVNDYWISKNGPGDTNWRAATYYYGDLVAYDVTGKSTYLTNARNWAQGAGFNLLNGDTSDAPDPQAAGQVYLRLAQLDGAASDTAHITTDIHAMLNSGNNPWTYVDALNMSMPNFAQLGVLQNDPSYFSKMYTLFSATKSALYDGSKHLWWRDRSFAGGSVHWSRGNGWAFAAMAKVLAVVPQSDAHYQEYLQTFKDMAAALVAAQRSDGFWNANLTDPNDNGGPETSGTSFFLFGMSWGVKSGVLDAATYLPVATKAWSALSTTAVQSSGLLGYVQPEGVGPAPTSATTTSDFGVGAFLLGGSAFAQL